MSENTEDGLRKWLSEQGYPLEMRIARTFLKAGFSVIQSAYYSASEAGSQREIDLIAYRDHRCGRRLLRIEFVIECKSSKKKPWLLFCADQRELAPPARVIQRIGTERGTSFLSKLCQRKDIQELRLFTLPQPVGYSATQAHTTGNDIVYAAATSVGNAAAGLASELDASPQSREIVKLLFPVIVTEGLLFSCQLDNGGELALERKTRGTLLWRNRLSRMPHTIIEILTEEAASDFAVEMRQSIDAFFTLTGDEFLRVCPSKDDPELPD